LDSGVVGLVADASAFGVDSLFVESLLLSAPALSVFDLSPLEPDVPDFA
jgi:hypothetical protein